MDDGYAGAAKKAMAAPTWKGKGGYTYTLLDDERIQVLDGNGQVTYANPGTTAHAAIVKEVSPPPETQAEEMHRKAPGLMATP